MYSSRYLLSSLHWAWLVCISAASCIADQNETIVAPSVEEKVEAQDRSVPQFEEVLPDSGMMENINPEEIITDDWTSDSPDAEADEN